MVILSSLCQDGFGAAPRLCYDWIMTQISLVSLRQSLPILAWAVLSSSAAVADVMGPGGKVQDCYCTDKAGSRVELGETRCLSVDGRSFMAQCQMSLNVPMWREVSAFCPSASLTLPPRPHVTRPISKGATIPPRL